MLGLGRLLNHREQGSDHRYDGLVEGLLQRVSEAALIEDRREALLQLKDLVGNDAQAQNALASLGYPVICAVLRDEREDIDMLRAAIECINTSTSQDNRRTPQVGPATPCPAPPPSAVPVGSAAFAECVS